MSFRIRATQIPSRRGNALGQLLAALVLIAGAIGGSLFVGQLENRDKKAPKANPARPTTAVSLKEDDQPTPANQSEKPPMSSTVVIETSLGTVKARLFTDKAPLTAQNFIDLAEKGYYDGIIFHRVIKDFMVQTGDPTGTGRGGRTDKGLPAKKLKDEFHPDLKHSKAGILSMANAGPNTGDTQFFITTVPTPWLDNKHAIFGEVIEGLDIVKKIEGVPTGAQDRPKNEVKMIKVRVVKPEAEEKK